MKKFISENKYIVKNLAPWMMDELIALSEMTRYDLIFLREQKDFYNEGLKKLEANGIRIYKQTFRLGNIFKKLVVLSSFFFKNLSNFSFDYNFILGIKSIILFVKLDLDLFSEKSNIHAQFATQAAIISFLIKKYYSNKPIYSFTFHAYDIYFKNRWFKLLINDSLHGFSISNYNIRYINQNYGKSEKIRLTRLGVFRDNMKPIYKVGNSDIFRMGLLSWFTEKKGIIFLLTAIKRLKDEGTENIKLFLAGDGPLKDEIMEYINDNELNGIIEYIGVISEKEKDSFFLSLDTFILPSISLKNDQDGIPVVLMEAIAYGLPLISTRVSGIPEICIDDYNGFLIEEKNVQEIVDAIEVLMSDIKVRERFSQMSLELSKKYDIRINTLKKIQLLGWKLIPCC